MMEVNPESASCVHFIHLHVDAEKSISYFTHAHPHSKSSLLRYALFLPNMFYSNPKVTTLVVGLLCLISTTVNATPSLEPRQIPANATDVTTIKSPTGVTIRYKEPGKAGVCETTPGVGSYSGYVDLSPTSHTFFWFFEARHNPETAPLTLWLNGGPGSDSLIGLFQGVHNPKFLTH